MNKNDSLFLLVKSLNKNEKGYFKKYSKSNDNNYLKLFDAIVKQNKYKEEHLLKKFEKEIFSKQLHVTKNLLFNSILRSLQDYHYDRSYKIILKNTIRNVEILYDKGLYGLCLKSLSKAKKQAMGYENETYLLLLEIIEWERRLIVNREMDIRRIQDMMSHLEQEEEEILKKHINSRRYRFLVDKIFLMYYIKGVTLDKEDQKYIEGLARHPLLKDERNALSILAKISFNGFFEIFYSIKNDPLSVKFAKRKVELIETHPVIAANNPMLYLNSLNNLRVMYYYQKNYKGVFDAFDKINTIPEKTIDIKRSKFISGSIPKVSAYCQMGQFQKASEHALSISKELKNFEQEMPLSDKLLFYIEITYAFFGSEDYKMAIKWLNKITNEKNKGERGDVMDSVKLLSIIVHYELHNFDLLESLIKSTLRSFEIDKSRYHFELLFIQALKKLLQEKNEKSGVIILKAVKGKMIKDFKTMNGTNNYEIILNWIESKIEKRSFADIVKEKAKPFLQ